MEFISSTETTTNTSETITDSVSFRNIFAEGLIIEPFDINYGYSLNDVNIPCQLFNPSDIDIVLESIDITGGGSISTDINFPLTIKPYETVNYNLVFKRQDAFFFGEIIYNYNGKNEKIQKVNIESMLSIKSEIDYGSSVLENFQFMTSINKSYNGKEHRIQLIDNPRLSISGEFILIGSERRKVENELNKGMGKELSIPIYSLSTNISQNFPYYAPIQSISGREIIINERYSILQQGMRVIIQEGEVKEEAVIYHADGNRIIFYFNLKNSYSKNATILPYALGTLSDQVSIQRLTNDIISMSFVLTVKDNLYRHLQGFDDLQLPEYKQLPVFNTVPDRLTHNNNLDSDFITIGASFGPRTMLQKNIETENIHSMSYINFNKEEDYQMKALLNYGKGRLNYFWLPTLNRDFEIVDNITSLTTTLKVERSIYYNNYSEEYIRIKDVYGNEYYREITNYIINDSEEFIVIDSALGVDLSVNEVEIVDFIKKVRFDSDRFTFSVLSNETSQINLSMKEVL